MPSLFDVQMREAELRNPNTRSYREVGSPAFERELESMVQSRASQGTQPMVTTPRNINTNILGERIQPSDVGVLGQLGERARSAGGLLASGANVATNALSDAGKGLYGLYSGVVPEIVQGGREFAANLTGQEVPADQSGSFIDNANAGIQAFENTSALPSFDATSFDTEAGSQEELMQQTAETMANLKTGKDVTPKQASDAADVVKQDTVAKGGDVNMFKEAPEGVDKGVWDSFNGQFDLTTIGLTLLATNGNGKNLAANMGLALQAGLESKKNELSAAASGRLKAEDRALAREGKLASIELDKAKTRDAIADSKAKLAGITSAKPKPINTTQIAVEQAYLSGLTGDGKAKDMPKDTAELAASHRQTLRNSGVTDKSTQDQMIYEALDAEGFLDEKFFGGFALTSVADRLGL